MGGGVGRGQAWGREAGHGIVPAKVCMLGRVEQESWKAVPWGLVWGLNPGPLGGGRA